MHLDRNQQITVAWALLPIHIIWLVNGFYLSALARIGASIFWLADIFNWILLPILTIVFISQRTSLTPDHYGLARRDLRWHTATLGTIAVFVTCGLIFGWMQDLSWQLFGQPAGNFSLPNVFPDGLLGKVALVYSSVTAGIVESIFFIGLPWVLYQNFSRTGSQIAFASLVSLIFGVGHWEQGPHVVVGAFCFSLAACCWYFRLGTLWPVAVGHALIDLAAFS